MSETEKSIRVLPMPVVHAVWGKDDDEYPGTVKVSFSNGKVRSYRLEIEQPKPNTYRGDPVAELIRKNTYGGEQTPGYKGKHEKKSR